MASSTPQYPNPETVQEVWGQLASAASGDAALRQQLLSDPAAALSKKGVTFPSTVRVKTQAGASGVTMELPLPNRPAQLGEARLDASAPSVAVCSSCCCSC